MRLLTYNVHQCIGTDKQKDIDRVLLTIKSSDADVVALQEIDHEDSGDANLVDLLQSAGYIHTIYGQTLIRENTRYGNLLVSKHKTSGTRLIDITIPPFEPRGIIVTDIESPIGKIKLFATHLGLGRKERSLQSLQLISEIKRNKLDNYALLGDFNEWSPRSKVLRNISSNFNQCITARTFPANFPLFKLDRIYWSSPTYRAKRIQLPKSNRGHASDHFPMLVEIF